MGLLSSASSSWPPSVLGVPKTSGGFGVKRFPPAQPLPDLATISSFLLLFSDLCVVWPASAQDPRVVMRRRVGVGAFLGAGLPAGCRDSRGDVEKGSPHPPACWRPAVHPSTHRPRLQNSGPRVGGGAERKGVGNTILLGGMGHQRRLAGAGQSFWLRRELLVYLPHAPIPCFPGRSSLCVSLCG